MNRLELGEKLKNKRITNKLTLSQMLARIKAAGAEVSMNYLSSLERGGVELPNRMRLRHIALAYRVDPRVVSQVFYPDDDHIELESEVNTVFEKIIRDQMFDVEERDQMLKGQIGLHTKIFLIRLYEKAKDVKVLKDSKRPHTVSDLDRLER